jgi:hypothetical protein
LGIFTNNDAVSSYSIPKSENSRPSGVESFIQDGRLPSIPTGLSNKSKSGSVYIIPFIL